MAQAADLSPPIDSTIEEENVTFDFGPALGQGVSISSVNEITCIQSSGTGSDPTPASRIIGSSTIAGSPSTLAPNAAVIQKFGTMIGDCVYTLQCVVNTSDGQQLSLWTRLECVTPS